MIYFDSDKYDGWNYQFQKHNSFFSECNASVESSIDVGSIFIIFNVLDMDIIEDGQGYLLDKDQMKRLERCLSCGFQWTYMYMLYIYMQRE